MALQHLTGEELSDAILVVDEAHNLADRARQIFSPEILEEDLRPLLNRLLLQPGDLFGDLARSVEEMIEILEQAAEMLPEGEAIGETDPPADAIHAWRADWEPKLLRYLAWKRESRLADPDDPVLDVHFLLQRFAAVLNLYGPDFTCVVERRDAGVRLALLSASTRPGPWRRSFDGGVLGDPDVGDLYAGRVLPARARPRPRPDLLDLAAAARSRRRTARS